MQQPSRSLALEAANQKQVYTQYNMVIAGSCSSQVVSSQPGSATLPFQTPQLKNGGASGGKTVLSRQVMMSERVSMPMDAHQGSFGSAIQDYEQVLNRNQSSMLQQYSNGRKIQVQGERIRTQIQQQQPNISRTTQSKYDTEANIYGKKSDNLQAANGPEESEQEDDPEQQYIMPTRGSLFTSIGQEGPEAARMSSVAQEIARVASNTEKQPKGHQQKGKTRQYSKTAKGSVQSSNTQMKEADLLSKNKRIWQADVNKQQVSGLTRLEQHEQALLNNRQKKAQQAGISTNIASRLPTEQEYGIPLVQIADPNEENLHLRGVSSKTNDFDETLGSAADQSRVMGLFFQDGFNLTQQADGEGLGSIGEGAADQQKKAQLQTQSQNKLPDTIFTQVSAQFGDLTGVMRDKHQPAWKQVRQQRRSEVNTQRKLENANSAYQQTGKVLNASIERKSAYGSNNRSPYQQISDRNPHGPQLSSEAIITSNRQSLTKGLNRSQSIENERNRIHDVVRNLNTTALPNVCFIRTESHNSPSLRQGPESIHPFGSPTNGETIVSRVQNPVNLTVASIYQRSDDPGIQIFSGQTTRKAGMTQSSSSKGIPQIASVSGATNLKTATEHINATRSLYQTNQINNKYNFITPMILSDLHLISATHQIRSDFPQEEMKEDRLISPCGTGTFSGQPIMTNPRHPAGNSIKQTIKSAQASYIDAIRAHGGEDMFKSMPLQGQHTRTQEQNKNPTPQNMRPLSSQRPIGSNLPTRSIPFTSSGEVNTNAVPPPFVSKRRHLKTPAVYSTQDEQQAAAVVPEQQVEEQARRKLKQSIRPAKMASKPKLEPAHSSPHTILETNEPLAESPFAANGGKPKFDKDTSSQSSSRGHTPEKHENFWSSRVKANLTSEQTQEPQEDEKKDNTPKSRLKSRNKGIRSTAKKQKRGKTQVPEQEDISKTEEPLILDACDRILQEDFAQHNQPQLSQPSPKRVPPVCEENKTRPFWQPKQFPDSDEFNWSVKSVVSSCTSLASSTGERLQGVPREEDMEGEKRPVIANNVDGSLAPAEGKEAAPNIDFFSEQKLVVFNQMTLERERLSEDPVQFSQQKVQGYLMRNPLNQRLIQKNKGQLPNSVFKPHANQVTFLKSIFEGRPPVAFFQYPSYVGIKRVADRIRMYTREEVEHLFMSFRISDSAHIYNAVVNSCKSAGFTMLESNNTNLFNMQWTGYISANDIKHLNKYQKTNHFPGSIQLGRKDLLWRNFSRMRSKFAKDFVITPISYLIQEEYEAFLAERERDSNALWILKPVAGSCGRGIKIINSTQRINKKEGYLAVKYIDNPHLINGLKYDMRVYALVTSFCPLRVYMYNDGLVRFATEKYSNDPRKLQKKFVHLTNFAINKKNINFVKNQDKYSEAMARRIQNGTQIDEDQQEFDQNSSKWDFKMLRHAYEKKGINYEYVIAQFKDLIVKTLLCVEPIITQNLQKNPTSRVNCFELYGFDIMVDSNHKPWVLEVNVLPSLSSSSPFDKRIKTQLICDTLTLVGIRGYDKQKFHSQTTELLGLAPFSQSMTLSELRQKPRLTGQEKLTKDELEMLMDMDEEFMRRGNFQRIFPLASNASFYEQFFETKRYQNALCAAYLTSPQHIRDQLLHKYRRIYNSQV